MWWKEFNYCTGSGSGCESGYGYGSGSGKGSLWYKSGSAYVSGPCYGTGSVTGSGYGSGMRFISIIHCKRKRVEDKTNHLFTFSDSEGE